MLKGFKDFILRGNVIELGVAVVMASAFGAVVTSFTEGIIDPLLAAVGGPESIGLGFHLRPGNDATFINLGSIITATITFLITAAVIYFVLILPMNKATELAARRKGIDAEEVSEASEVELLVEIRDLLRSQQGLETDGFRPLNDDQPKAGEQGGKHSI
ncbi:large conductance mechanosensitive channel protein MscL [Corynebacterium sp. zg254]|uniref:large conductance mechanosensitive channel protein MscL n=1 Tax=Corynebacterium sp. zg254 TaxID=2656645 RepID=UPI002150D881|nr:large conductance mechanosensitive channel protein MscL [Corynebacterium sp. zg254]MCR5913864.1 large conductance mechanosensitive channel protein MscL [Corynebacterium sp. zg254]